MKRSAPAVARNREPLLAVLRQVLPPSGTFLEIASGTGEHSVYFAAALPALQFLPSDADAGQVESIEAWRAESGLSNVLPARCIDVTREEWETGPVDVVFCANMIHIAPPVAMTGLVGGAARHLVTGGLLVTYGPYKIDGRHTAPSNEEFERWLLAQNPSYGVRDLEDLTAQAAEVGLEFEGTFPMPANNFTVVLRKRSAPY